METTEPCDPRLAKIAAGNELPESGSVYERITQRVIAALEAGTTPWMRPWATTDAGPRNVVTGHAYRGINVLMLWMTAASRGYTSDRWVTARWLFNEGRDLGVRLRRKPGFAEGPTGQKTTSVVYWGKIKPKDTPESEEPVTGQIFAKTYGVFNLDQLEGVPDEWIEKPVEREDLQRQGPAADYALATGASFIYGGELACYAPIPDNIRLPYLSRYIERLGDGWEAQAHYYGTVFHELTHWTGARHRLAREGIIHPRPAPRIVYAYEELIAEMGAAFLSARFGFDTIQAHANYVDSWLAALRRDNRLIVRAAAAAQRAVEYLDSLQPKEPT